MKSEIQFTHAQIFQNFTPSDLQFLKQNSKVLKVKRGQNLFFTGEKPVSLYAVASGCLKSVRDSQSGQSFITRIVGRGKIIGLRELFMENNYNRSCVAIDDSVVFAIHGDAIISLIKKNPNVGLHFITLFSCELTRIENMLESHLTKSAKNRLASVLYDFYQMFTIPNTHSFICPLQRKDIAELVAMTPETVSRVLHDFKKSKIIQTKGKYFTVLNVDALRNYDEE